MEERRVPAAHSAELVVRRGVLIGARIWARIWARMGFQSVVLIVVRSAVPTEVLIVAPNVVPISVPHAVGVRRRWSRGSLSVPASEVARFEWIRAEAVDVRWRPKVELHPKPELQSPPVVLRQPARFFFQARRLCPQEPASIE